MRIAINGFGRIGRAFLRCLFTEKTDITVVTINVGNADIQSVAHMFKYDTLMGMFAGSVVMRENYLMINDCAIEIIAELSPENCDWKARNIDWVVDCSGKFTHRSDAQKHLDAGAGYVLISAPAHDEDVTIIPGVNEKLFNPEQHRIVSLGSCTSNAVLPTLKILHDNFVLERAYMTTTHAYTNSQVLLDGIAKDLRFSRAAALNIIPAATGASGMIEKVIPDLKDKVSAVAIRVPIAKVSLIDVVFHAHKELSVDAVHNAFKNASQTDMRNIVSLTQEPLVSSDFSGSAYSVVIDALLTQTHGKTGQLFGWYDNEWGYSMRLKDFLTLV